MATENIQTVSTNANASVKTNLSNLSFNNGQANMGAYVVVTKEQAVQADAVAASKGFKNFRKFLEEMFKNYVEQDLPGEFSALKAQVEAQAAAAVEAAQIEVNGATVETAAAEPSAVVEPEAPEVAASEGEKAESADVGSGAGEKGKRRKSVGGKRR